MSPASSEAPVAAGQWWLLGRCFEGRTPTLVMSGVVGAGTAAHPAVLCLQEPGEGMEELGVLRGQWCCAAW